MNRQFSPTLSVVALFLAACSKEVEHHPLVGTWNAKVMRHMDAKYTQDRHGLNLQVERIYSFSPDGTWQNINYLRAVNEEEKGIVYFSGIWKAEESEVHFHTSVSSLHFDPNKPHSYEFHFPSENKLKLGNILFTLSHVDPVDLSEEYNANKTIEEQPIQPPRD